MQKENKQLKQELDLQKKENSKLIEELENLKKRQQNNLKENDEEDGWFPPSQFENIHKALELRDKAFENLGWKRIKKEKKT